MLRTDERIKGTMCPDEVVKQYKAGQGDFSRANLRYADLTGIILCGADLTQANLTGADLTGANLRGTHPSYANLTGVKVTAEQLEEALSPQGATMPDGTVPNCLETANARSRHGVPMPNQP